MTIEKIEKPKFPIFIVSLVAFMTLILIVTSTVYAIQQINELILESEKFGKISSIYNNIKENDLVLGNAVFVSAWTGQDSWENIYETQLEVLQLEIANLERKIDSDDIAMFHSIKNYSDKLQLNVDQSRKIFDYSREKRPSEAQKILYSIGYQKNKKNAEEELLLVGDLLNNSIIKNQNNSQRVKSIITVELFAAITGLVFLAVFLAKILASWKRMVIHLLTHLESELDKRTSEIRIALESQIQNAKLASLGEMSSGIFHEIVNPLMLIQVNSDLLQKEANKLQMDTLQVQRSAKKISQMTIKIHKIIKGLKAISRNDENDPFEVFSFEEILQDAQELCGFKIKNGSVIITNECPSNLALKGRPTQICQVFTNLISNSCDALSKLDERWIKFQYEELVSTYKIYVIDSGYGIPDSSIDNIMTPFFTTKEAGKGTGLGLSISRKIVESHGGSLEYLKGRANTTFVLTFSKAS